MGFLERSEVLLGSDGINRLKEANIYIFGLGGVGSFVAEGLVRSGVGSFTLVDNDIIDISNINRQLQADSNNIGEIKAIEIKRRMININPEVKIEVINKFYLPENREDFFRKSNKITYIVDAIDTITSKIDLAKYAFENDIPIISSMGAGNKLDPTGFKVSDIFKTEVDPIARVMRRELRARGVKSLKVVYSKEVPIKHNKPFPGSVSFVPSVVGLIIAGTIVKDIVGVD